MTNNEMQWSSATPGLLIIMVDQSGSMMKPYYGDDSRTQYAAKAVNRVINTLIQKNFDGKAPKNRCFIMVIGYDVEVKKIASGFLQTLEQSPLRFDEVMVKVPDGAGGLVEIKKKVPVWIEPIDKDRWTNMTGAFQMAKDTIEAWLQDKPNNPAPVIINISDGRPYYDKKEISVCVNETIEIVNQIKAIDTNDGKVQIFNAMLGDGEQVIFPVSNTDIVSDEAKFLYEISTEIPEAYKVAAEKNELKFEMGARGAIYNADAEHLVKLIDFGSSKGKTDN